MHPQPTPSTPTVSGLEGGRRALRRLAALAVAGLSLLAAPAVASAQTTDSIVRGTVYEDRDGDRVQGPGERGLSGVSVSDGQRTVRTGGDGRYELAIDPARRITDLVFVTTPDGYRAPLDDAQTARLWEDLGRLDPGEQRTADFGLRRVPRGPDRRLSYLVFNDMQLGVHDRYTDTHPGKNGLAEDEARFASQMADLNAFSRPADFLLIPGDLTHDATESQFDAYERVAATSDRPIHPVAGNHEFTSRGSYAERIDRYRRRLGPEWYSFNQRGRHFVVLENSRGYNQADQLEWLRRDLAENGDRPVVAAMHVPFDTPNTPEEGFEPYRRLLERYDTRIVHMAHSHVNDVNAHVIPGAWHVETNSTGHNTNDQTPPGFRYVTLDGERPSFPFQPFGQERRLTAILPAPGGQVTADHQTMQVNALDSSQEVEKMRVKVDGRAVTRLRRTGWMTWAARWDASRLAPGEHEATITARDDTGERWERTVRFEVIAPRSVTPPTPGADWPMFHADVFHSGVAADALPPPLRLAWSHATEGRIVTSSPALVDGTAYVGLRDEDGVANNGLMAVRQSDGARRWFSRTDAMVQGSPAVAGGIVYAPDIRGTLYAMDATTGHELWRKRFAVDADGVQRGLAYHSPTVSDGAVYQGYTTSESSFLAKLDGRTGEQLWTVELERDQYHAISAVKDGGRVYTVAGGGYLAAIDDRTGDLVWKRRPEQYNWSHSTVAIDDGRLFVGFRTGLLVAMDAADGDTLWTYRSDDRPRIITEITASDPAVADGTVYMGFPDGNVTALDAATGTVSWEQRTGGGVISAPAISGDTVYVGSTDGLVHGLERSTGRSRWSFDTGTWQASSPAVSGNTLVVGAYDGNLYGFVPRG